MRLTALLFSFYCCFNSIVCSKPSLTVTMGWGGMVTLTEDHGKIRKHGDLGNPVTRGVEAEYVNIIETGAAIAAAAAEAAAGAEAGATVGQAAEAIGDLVSGRGTGKLKQVAADALLRHGPKAVGKVLEHMDIQKEKMLSKLKVRKPTTEHKNIAAQLGLKVPTGGKSTAIASLSNLPSHSSDLGSEAVRRVHMPHEMVATVYNNLGTMPIKRRAEYHINPANHPLFPWLHAIAAKYGFWRFENLEFKFTSTTPKTAKGSIAMCIYYDTEDHPPRTISDFMNTETGVVSYIGENCVLRANPQMLMGGLSIKRCRGAATPYDMNLFDGGHFYFETWGGDSADEAGWLTVSYDVVFWMPTPYLGVGSVRPQNRSYLESTLKTIGYGSTGYMTFSVLTTSRDISVDDTGSYTGESANVGVLLPTGQWHVEIKIYVSEINQGAAWPIYSVQALPTSQNGCTIEQVGGFLIETGYSTAGSSTIDTVTNSSFFVALNVSDPDTPTGYTNDERGFKIAVTNGSGATSYNVRVGLCIMPA